MSGHDALVDANRELGRRFFAEQDRLRGGPAPALCAPDYEAVLGGAPPVDRTGHEHFAAAFYGAFPDLAHTLEQVIATSDRVAVRFVLTGRHQAAFFGIPATGRAVRVVAHAILHVSDGRVTRLFGVFDEAGLLRQLGILPSA
jgi:steroid delta-isomerase-like uncharacterized protein